MKKKKLTEPPAGIVINIPNVFLDVEYPGGEAAYRKTMERPVRDDEVIWYNFISNIPVHQVIHCYIAFKGFIHYRCNIADFFRNRSLTFHDERGKIKTRPRNWVVLCGPLIKAPATIPQKGFRWGFRYVPEQLF